MNESKKENLPEHNASDDEADNGTEILAEMRSSWAGPLPPPEALRGFDEVVENGARRIFESWEQESNHRRDLQRKELSIFGWNSILGRVFAFIFVLAALGLAAFCASINQPWVAAILGGGTIAAVVLAFITTQRPSSEED